MNRKSFTYVKQCPDCGHNKTLIKDCREWGDGSFRRRRQCAECGYEFYTVEIEESVSELGNLWSEIEELKREKAVLEDRIARIKEIIAIV